MTIKLSLRDARKLILLSQKLPPKQHKGSNLNATLNAIGHLGYIQIDTISVIERAHHHTLWNRNPQYKPLHLDQLLEQKHVFEYWSHAASYLPMKDFRFSLIRKQALASGSQSHWYKKDEKVMKEVLQRIKSEGPLMAKDFDHNHQKEHGWASKPAKRALECLFMQGDLMIPHRNNFHKVYDITERVLPDTTDITIPTEKEYARFLVLKYLGANGLGNASEISYLLKKTKPLISSALQELCENKEILPINVEGNLYYALSNCLEQLNNPLSQSKLKILSPFDNLLIQRKRMQSLFGFDYLIECYVPKAKRKYGYFSLPILCFGKLLARMDCKADRKSSTLHIYNLVMEPISLNTDRFINLLTKELHAFSDFNHCQHIHIHRTFPTHLKDEIQSTLNI